jgi:tRNA(Ile2) C34 agmatinyltransferase TiaS
MHEHQLHQTLRENPGTIVTTETKKTINNNLHYTMQTTIHEHQLHQTLRENPGTIVTTETKKTINNNLHYTMQTTIHQTLKVNPSAPEG